MNSKAKMIDYAQRLVDLMSSEALIHPEDPIEYARACVRQAEAHDLSLHTVIKTGLGKHALDDLRNNLSLAQHEAGLQLCAVFEYLTARSGYAVQNIMKPSIPSTAPSDGEAPYWVKAQADYSRFMRELPDLGVDRSGFLMFVIEGLPASVIDKARRKRNGSTMGQVKTGLTRFAEIRGLQEPVSRHRFIGEMRSAA